MKKIVVLFIVTVLTAIVAVFLLTRPAAGASIRFNNGPTISIEVARATADLERGLAGHTPLDDQRGMLFVWDTQARRTFWMKGMTFPIDIIWISSDTVVGVEKNVPAPTKPEDLPTYPSPSNVDQVLEVAAGWTDRNQIIIGEKVSSSF